MNYFEIIKITNKNLHKFYFFLKSIYELVIPSSIKIITLAKTE